jgi:hypothetical protein
MCGVFVFNYKIQLNKGWNPKDFFFTVAGCSDFKHFSTLLKKIYKNHKVGQTRNHAISETSIRNSPTCFSHSCQKAASMIVYSFVDQFLHQTLKHSTPACQYLKTDCTWSSKALQQQDLKHQFRHGKWVKEIEFYVDYDALNRDIATQAYPYIYQELYTFLEHLPNLKSPIFDEDEYLIGVFGEFLRVLSPNYIGCLESVEGISCTDIAICYKFRNTLTHLDISTTAEQCYR